jgi:hypothetical protein
MKVAGMIIRNLKLKKMFISLLHQKKILRPEMNLLDHEEIVILAIERIVNPKEAPEEALHKEEKEPVKFEYLKETKVWREAGAMTGDETLILVKITIKEGKMCILPQILMIQSLEIKGIEYYLMEILKP